MSEHQDAGSSAHSPPEQELELEVARLTAELEALRGETDPATATSRFLAMAATTVDMTLAEARREADELAFEISAAAEIRRDEATRLAAEAEATAERLLSEADKAREIVYEAEVEADSIRAAACDEADRLVTAERARMADERTTLNDVREALEHERAELDSYQRGLQRRVGDLAQSMLAIMATELAPESRDAVENLLAPALQPADDAEGVDRLVAAMVSDEFDQDVPDHDTVLSDDPETEGDQHFGGVAVIDEPEETEEPMPERAKDLSAPDAAGDETDEDLFDYDPATDPSRDLFGPATDDEVDTPQAGGSLFGSRGAKLVEQTDPDDLAEVLAEEDSADDAFQEFLTGDDEPDPSRDWLLRPDKS